MPELERWVLHRLVELDATIRQAIKDFDFPTMIHAIHNFCAVDLSAFYFDVRKDSLYCDGLDDDKRRATRTVLDLLFNTLTVWIAPILPFTAEEAWLTRLGDGAAADESVHRQQFPEIPADWRDDTLAAKWRKVRALRRVVTGAIEVERREKRVRASLEAAPVVYASQAYADALAGLDLAELAITSSARLEVAPGSAGRLHSGRC